MIDRRSPLRRESLGECPTYRGLRRFGVVIPRRAYTLRERCPELALDVIHSIGAPLPHGYGIIGKRIATKSTRRRVTGREGRTGNGGTSCFLNLVDWTDLFKGENSKN
jgi:hypothetical protein